MILSASLLLAYAGIIPLSLTETPITPINTAIAREITTHIEATLLDTLSLSSSLIAINLNRM